MSDPNASLIGTLGFAPDAKVVVVHVDDVGMSPSANEGLLHALEGAATCGSVMVPCPAFREIAQIARRSPALDLGVHLTLNCEYAGYRWSPLRDDVPGLRAPDGGMWRTTADTVAHASPDEVERELRAQIDAALDAGIDVTHLDSHMGTVFDLKFAEVYIQLGLEYRLPLFLPRVRREALLAAGLPDAMESYLRLLDGAEAAGLPLFDHFDVQSLHFEPGSGLAHNRERVARLGPGLAYLVTHCAVGDEALAAITPDWRQRGEECEIYGSDAMVRVLADAGCRTIGMRPIRDLTRAAAAA
jgi:chitin disaccharide deacetylase